jgi:hypothetical protein
MSGYVLHADGRHFFLGLGSPCVSGVGAQVRGGRSGEELGDAVSGQAPRLRSRNLFFPQPFVTAAEAMHEKEQNREEDRDEGEEDVFQWTKGGDGRRLFRRRRPTPAHLLPRTHNAEQYVRVSGRGRRGRGR